MSGSRRSSLGSPPQTGGSTPDLKQRIITCLNKLSDRDTLAMATAELESIARNLTHDSFATFLICIHNTDASSKPPVRKQCASLLTLLSNSHGDALAPFLSKMISTVLRRLRDPDSAVRSACVDAVAAMSSQIKTPEFASSFLKPLMDTLAVEQDSNSQIGSALCLAAAIDAAPEVEMVQLRKSLARLGKLAKSDSFKAKAALMVLIGSIVGGGAAEALGKVASVETDLAPLYKVPCLNALESRRFDKVKVVRETMNNTLEMWKVLTGDSDEVSAPIQSRCSIDNENDRSFPTISKSSNDSGFRSPQTKKTVPTNRSPPSNGSLVTTAKKGSPQSRNGRSDTTKLTTLDHKKPSDWKIEIKMPISPSSKVFHTDDIVTSDFGDEELGKNEPNGNSLAENKRVLFSRTCDEKAYKFGGLRSRSRVVPFDDENYDSDVVVINSTEELYESPKDAEDLSLIRAQLIQIENQQANLFDLSRKHMLQAAWCRVLEFQVLAQNRRPVFYAKLSSSSGTFPSINAGPDKDTRAEPSFDRQRFQHQSRGAYTVNPLAETHGDSRAYTGCYPDRTSKSIVQDAERVQIYKASRFEGVPSANCIASRNLNRR
ncbi:hypothetical protein M0R45_022679 [Rubus argutus]|uniref:TORTIFOLIA1/SINE1-2 N-terminal domain-containing protein n=1 Tax=Rubus argutus TaxID=59490 RepID=A0AAW1XII7_RUBAR